MTTSCRGVLMSFFLLAWAFTAKGQAASIAVSNLLLNAGFEKPTKEGSLPSQWEYRSSDAQHTSVTRQQFQTGAQCLQMQAYGVTGGFQAVEQSLDVMEGEKFEFSANVKSDARDAFRARDQSGSYGQLVILWLDASGKEVGRVWSQTWDHMLSRVRWQRYAIDEAEVPGSAVRATFGIHFYEGPSGALGTFLVDDASVRKTAFILGSD